MASRSNICINDKVAKIGNPEEINQKCKKLVDNTKVTKDNKSNNSCQFYDLEKILELSMVLNVKTNFFGGFH